jgi:choline dehydrogenase
VRFDVVVVGGGTAGCVLAARLSENADRTVCLLEAGPDYGSLAEGRWPAEILDARRLPTTHDWQPAPGDIRTLGGRLLGGSSAINAAWS